MRRLICFIILLITTGSVFASQKDTGRIEAVIYDSSGALVPGSKLYVYLNNKADFRGPADYVSEKTGINGKTSIDLASGKYFVIARKRIKEEDVGPLKEGDFFGKYDKNPVELKSKDNIKIELVMEKIEGKMPLSPLSPKTSIFIEGVLKDEQGLPLKNSYAMAYRSKEINGRPDYMSKPSDENGKFIIYISEPGRYFIIGRIKYGSPPKLGEPYGTYNENGIEVGAGSKPALEIIFKPFDLDLDNVKR